MVRSILFLVFINDIVQSSYGSKFILFADDTSVFISDKSPASLVSRTNEMLSDVKSWLIRNCLTLNEQKTQYMVFYRRQRASPILENVILGENAVNRVKCVKFLGLHIDDHLIWDHHVNHVVKVLSKYASILFKLKSQLNETSLLLIYNALVYPNITYCQSL